jgi:hypothetical protein
MISGLFWIYSSYSASMNRGTRSWEYRSPSNETRWDGMAETTNSLSVMSSKYLLLAAFNPTEYQGTLRIDAIGEYASQYGLPRGYGESNPRLSPPIPTYTRLRDRVPFLTKY